MKKPGSKFAFQVRNLRRYNGVLEAAQMGPFGPAPRTGEAALGCFEDDDDDDEDDGDGAGAGAAADYRAEAGLCTS